MNSTDASPSPDPGPDRPHLTEPRALRLRTLGRCDLVSAGPGGAPQPVAEGGRPLVILAYLAAAPGRSATRERLVAVFWPDRPEDRGRHALRQQLVNLRKLLGPEAILVSDQSVVLGEAVADDRSELLRAARAGDAEAVVTLYGGDFLPDVEASGGIELQHWCGAERRHLRAMFVRSARDRIPLVLAQERTDDALRLATRLRDADPGDQSNWRVLLQTLVRTGRLLDARIEADALDARQQEGNDSRDPELTAIIQRIRTPKSGRAASGSATRASVDAPFVGRDRPLSRLLAGWQRARDGGTEVVAVSGAAGLGKTRLMHELAQRLRADGARVVQLRAHPGERSTAHSLAGDLALRLGKLPGAGGVAPETSSILVGLAPELSSHFPAARGERPTHGEGGRTAHALADLARCVAEERPYALLLDDWHWADRESVRAIDGMIRRLGSIGILVILASRTRTTFDDQAHHGLELLPLTVDDTRTLLGELGELPEPLLESLPALVHAGGRGSPLLMLHLLRRARDRGWLVLDETWTLVDGEALRLAAREGGALESRIEELTVEQRTVLRLVALDGVPISGSVLALASVLGSAAFEGAVLTLERLGLVEHADDAWRPAHDEVARAATAPVTPGELAALRLSLGEAYAAADDCRTEVRWRRAAVHLLAAGATHRFETLARAWMASGGAMQLPGGREAVAALLGQEVPEAVLRRASARRAWDRPTQRGALAAVGLATGLLILTGIASRGSARSSHLVIDAIPVANPADEPMIAPFLVNVVDARGRVTSISGDTMRAVAISGGTVVRGGNVPIVRGRADFAGLVLRGDTAVRLRLSAPGLPDLLTDSIYLGEPDVQSWLRLVRGAIAGSTLTPHDPVLRVARGGRLTGTLQVAYTSAWPSANMVMALTPTWGDRTAGCRRVRSLVTPVRGASLRVPVEERAPLRPGRYFLVLAFHAEDRAENVCSGTNWTHGSSVWHDGNDLADWGEAQARESAERGRVRNGFLSRHADGRERRATYAVPAVMIRVVVE